MKFAPFFALTLAGFVAAMPAQQAEEGQVEQSKTEGAENSNLPPGPPFVPLPGPGRFPGRRPFCPYYCRYYYNYYRCPYRCRYPRYPYGPYDGRYRGMDSGSRSAEAGEADVDLD